jgi:hypothetical protein
MENPLHSSFIPTRPATGGTPLSAYNGDATSRDITDIFVLIGTIALVITGTVAAGVFLYKLSVDQNLKQTKSDLERAEKAFNPKNVAELSRIDEQLRVAEGLLHSHIAPSVFFAVLQQTTLQSVQFKSLDFKGASADKLLVSMKGVATGVNAIALQANIFSRHPAVKDPIFQINDLTKDGVTFEVTFQLNPDVVNYEALVTAFAARQDSGQQQVQQEQVPDDGFGAVEDTTSSEQGTNDPQSGDASDGGFGSSE